MLVSFNLIGEEMFSPVSFKGIYSIEGTTRDVCTAYNQISRLNKANDIPTMYWIKKRSRKLLDQKTPEKWIVFTDNDDVTEFNQNFGRLKRTTKSRQRAIKQMAFRRDGEGLNNNERNRYMDKMYPLTSWTEFMDRCMAFIAGEKSHNASDVITALSQKKFDMVEGIMTD